MQAVAADQREERRQEGAAGRAGAARDEIGELAELDARESRARAAKVTAIATWNQRALRASAAMLARPQVKLDSSRNAVSIATLLQVEQLAPLGPPAVCPEQHRIGREEGREHHDVAEQENPEAEAGHDALRAPGRCDARRRRCAEQMRVAMRA